MRNQSSKASRRSLVVGKKSERDELAPSSNNFYVSD